MYLAPFEGCQAKHELLDLTDWCLVVLPFFKHGELQRDARQLFA